MQTISGRIEASTREIASAGDLIHDLSVKADEMGNLVRHFATDAHAANQAQLQAAA
jgi:aerotaxis receptor